MYTKGAELKAGLVVLVALGGMLAMMFFGGGSEPIWADYRYVHLRFEQGFTAPKAGDSVLMNGKIVGRVYQVDQMEQVYNGAELTPAVRGRLDIADDSIQSARELYLLCVVKMRAEQVLPRGTIAEIRSTFTGSRTLSLKPGISVEDITDEETRANPIPAREGVGLDDIMKTVQDLGKKISAFVDKGGPVLEEAKALLATIHEKVRALEADKINADIRTALASVNSAVKGLDADLDRIIKNVTDASGSLKDLMATGDAAVKQIQEYIEPVMEKIKSAVERLDDILEKAGPQIDSILGDISVVSKNLVQVSKDFKGIGPEAQRILEDFGVDLDLLLKTAQDAVRNLADATEDLRANPWKLTNKPDAEEIAYDNVRSAALSYLRAMRDLDEISRTLTSLLKRADVGSEAVKARIQETLEQFNETQRRVKRTEARFQELLSEQRPPDARGAGRRR